MFEGLFNISFTLELFTLAAGIILLGPGTGNWKFIPFFLAAGIVAETAGWYMGWKLRITNVWIFNINLCIAGIWLAWIIYQELVSVIVRRALIFISAVVLVLTFVGFLMENSPYTYNSRTEILIDLSIASASCYLLYELLLKPDYRSTFQYEYFWLANGALVASMGKALLSVSMPQFLLYQDGTGIRLWQYLNDILNLLLYFSLIIAFICRNRNTRRSRSL